MQTPYADTIKWVNNPFSRLFTSLQEAPIYLTPAADDIPELLKRLLPLQSGIPSSR